MTFFQGTTVHGLVRESDAQTFREVVDAFRICPTLGISRKAFLSLDKAKRDEIKQVPFFTAATFKASPSKRLHSEAKHCNLIFLDIDDGGDAAPFVRSTDALHAALEGFNFVAHTTASSTPEKPRMRVVVHADAISLADYPRAVATVAALLGLAKVTKESKVAVQPMFLPVLFSDSTDADHPLIAHRLDARAFTVADIKGEALSDYDRPQPKTSDAGDNSLDFLRAPVPEITLATAKEAMAHIDPDCGYHEWLEVAQALRHQFSPHKAEEAYAAFDEWSAQGSKYAGEDSTRAKWDSIRPTPVGRLPVTIRSLLRQAVAGGWDDRKVKESGFNTLVRWMEEEVKSITELMEHGVKKILSVPLLTAMQEDVLVHQLCVQAKKQFAYPLSTTAIRKDLARTKAAIKAGEKQPEKKQEPLWAKGVCYISATQEFFRHRTGEKYKAEALNASYSRWLLPKEQDLKDAGIEVTAAALAKPVVSPADYALNHLKIPTVYDYSYDPSQPAEVFFVSRGRKYVNTYSPTYPENDTKRADEAGKLFLHHLASLVAEEEYRRTLVDFMAFMVQSPGRKIRWAVLIQSVEGAGKTFLAEAAKAVLGQEHVKTISGEAIKKGWNEWSFGAQLVVLEEVRVAGTNRHEVMNALKPLVTNDDISINERNRNTRQTQNISNYMLFSNHHDALALTPGDRRYFVIKSPLQTKAQVLALGENYFPPLYAMLRDMPGALRSWLADWEISPSFSPDGHAPRTTHVEDMVKDSASDLTAAVRRLVAEADYPLIQFDIVSAKVLTDVLNIEDGMARMSPQQLAHVLREEGFMQIGRHLIGDDRHYLWIRRGVSETEAPRIAAARQRDGLKNLHMEIFF
jgi:hypothetical protein